MTYELSCVLDDHKADVLGLAVTQNDCIISCSRDSTAKSWLPNKSTGKYQLSETYSAQQNMKNKFLTCVCWIAPNDSFVKGLIVTGGNDNIILVFEPDSSVPFLQLTGHTNTVSKLVNSFEPNVILSASWDATVRIWKILPQASQCVKTIDFDQATVWAILHMKRNLICVGTADKTIRTFDGDGRSSRTLIGHDECVRDLVEVKDDEILSCSNDSTIRRWSVVTGMCLEIMYGHPNYIYSVRVFGDLVVSSGEDRCLLVWTKGHHLQTIILPARSVWTVAFLSNKDIVVGSSDGVIRIFSADKERQASQEILEAFRKESTNFAVPVKKSMGRPKITTLPGPDVLRDEGIREGETRIVRENDQVICYSWSTKETAWKVLGNVEANTPMFELSKKKKTPVSTEQRCVFVCALCRKSFSRKYILRNHFRKTKHSIANKTPARLRSVLPKDWHYYVCKFRRKGTKFRAEICLTIIDTVKEAHDWIRKFCDQNQRTYRRYSTKKSTGGLTAYAEFYRCQRAFVCRKSTKRRSNEKECKSTIHFAIKRGLFASSNYTKLNLNYVHNHAIDRALLPCKPSANVEEKFRLLFESGLSPLSAFCAYTDSPSGSALPDFDWVKTYHRGLYGDAVVEADVAEYESVANSTAVAESYVEEPSYMEYIVPDIDDVISGVEVEHEAANERLLRNLQESFDKFLAKLEEDDVRYYEAGILSMCNELKEACEASPRNRLSALLSFNKTKESR